MGNNTSLDKYRASLRKVDADTTWREDLIIHIDGRAPLIVYRIQPLDRLYNATELSNLIYSTTFINPGEQYFIYQYSGNKVDSNKSPIGKYAIFMKTLETVKIGGSQRNVTPLEIPSTLLHRHRGAVSPAEMLADDIEARTTPDFTSRDEDNIADD